MFKFLKHNAPTYESMVSIMQLYILAKNPFSRPTLENPPIWTPTLKQKNSSSSQNICENQKNPPILNKG